MNKLQTIGWCTVVLAGIVVAAEPPAAPWFVDDEKFNKSFEKKLNRLVERNETLTPADIKAKLVKKTCKLALAAKSVAPLAPEVIYQRTLPSVFVVGGLVKDDKKKNGVEEGTQATAFALTADGVLATNWHVLEDAGEQQFGVANHKGDVFPIIDILAGDPDTDILIIKVKGQGFQPLPLGDEPAVGAWTGLLSHPGGHLFSFAQGHVTRYYKDRTGDVPLDYMIVSNDYASGSSGGPVLDRCGNVVAIATTTVTIECDAEEPEKPKPRRRRQQPPPKPEEKKPQLVEMIVKQAVPVRAVRKLVSGAK